MAAKKNRPPKKEERPTDDRTASDRPPKENANESGPLHESAQGQDGNQPPPPHPIDEGTPKGGEPSTAEDHDPSSPSSRHLPAQQLKKAERISLSSETLAAGIEALLFASSKPLPERAIAKLLSVERRDVREAIALLQAESRPRGVEPVEVAGGWQLRTKPEFGPILRAYLQAKPARLSRAALESLAIIAYQQPITRADLEDIRGVDSGAVLRGLLERRLIKIIGRKEEPGRPILYGTAPGFLELFGLKSLRELPTLREFVELSEEHQRIVERQAPEGEDQQQKTVQEYLDELEQSGYIEIDNDDDEDWGSESEDDGLSDPPDLEALEESSGAIDGADDDPDIEDDSGDDDEDADSPDDERSDPPDLEALEGTSGHIDVDDDTTDGEELDG